MWIYYGLILISVVMFGGGFALNDAYRRKRGSGLNISMESACIGSLAGLIVLIIVNGLKFEFTPFTLLMAALTAINGLAFTFCSFRALDYINLSLFSLFAMLGGMVLPFLQGIFFFGESFTPAKGICLAFICAALLCTVERGEKKRGTVFYICVFILNGMSGVISKIFTSSELPKTSAAGYSIWCAIMSITLAGISWIVLSLLQRRKAGKPISAGVDRKTLWQSYGIGASHGIINKLANFLLVIALAHVDASVQYPMVTGGTMIVSTLICFFGDKKPSRREIFGVLLAFLGMLALFLI